MDIERLRQLESEGLISLRKHPAYGLWVANYTPEVQYGKLWTRELIKCRGLIVDNNGIVCHAIPKFFNWTEIQGPELKELYDISYVGIFSRPFKAYEKLDGSYLSRFCLPNGQWECATRGSFESEQAEKGRQIFQEKYSDIQLDPSLNFIFEIIFPANRIVVDYNGLEDIILLAVIDKVTGRELTFEEISDLNLPFKRPTVFNIDHIFDAEKEKEKYENFEGFVLDFGDGLRFKFKSTRYIAIHRIVSELTPRKVFEALRSGVSLEVWLKDVPDEFYQEIAAIAAEIREKWDNIDYDANADYCGIAHEYFKVNNNRKGFAEEAKKAKYPVQCMMIEKIMKI